MGRYKDLKDARFANGRLTQKEVADKLEISVNSYVRIENGEHIGSTKTWLKLQNLFNLTDEETWQLQKNKVK